MTPRSLSHRAPLLGLVLAWALGSALEHRGLVELPGGVWVGLALVGLVLAWAGGARRTTWAVGLLVALAAAGALRTDQLRTRLVEWDRLGLPAREAHLTLRITRVFALDGGEAQAAFASTVEGRAGGIAEIIGTAPHLRELRGQRIQFFTTWPVAERPALAGVEFDAVGLLRPVPEHPVSAAGEPNFDRYLADQGVNFSFNRARWVGDSGRTEASAWVRFCAAAGTRLEGILRTGLADHESLADLYVAMVLGRKQELSDAQEERFIRSGTMHLFAISGLHIAGIALAFYTGLTLLRLPPRVRFVAGTALLWTYVEITGGAPSAVRAFWMVTCLHGAHQLRSPTNSLSALAASALAVLVIDPHQLFSAGFQMSYGIVSALLLYGVPLQERWLAAWQPWARLPKTEWRWWQLVTEWLGRQSMSAVALGLAATLVSTPAALTFFGLISPGGFFVNLVLIPQAALVLFAGVAAMVAGAGGMALLASVFNHAGALVLAGMEGTVVLALRVPGVAWPAGFVSPVMGELVGAGMLALLACGYMRGWRNREGGYWGPYAALALVLVLGVRSVSGDSP